MRTVALTLPLVFFAPSISLYFGVDPLVTGRILVTSASILFVVASTQIEETEIIDEPEQDEQKRDEPEQDDPQPDRFEEVSTPFKNSMAIRLAHEPPANHDPARQRTLGQADFALAKLATGEGAISPVSFAEAKRHGYRFG